MKTGEPEIAMGKRASVLLLQRVLPPYRLPFFQRLGQSSRFALTVACGEASRDSALESVSNPPGLSLTSLRNSYFYRHGKEQVAYQHGALVLIRRGKYDVVIAEFNPRILSNVLAFLYCVRARIPFVWWGQGIGPHTSRTSLRVRIWLARLANATILYDQEQANKFVSMGVASEKVFVAENSIDTDEIERLAQPWRQSSRIRILYIGRLIPEKKVDLLIRAFVHALPHIPSDNLLTIIGAGPELARLRQLSDSLGVSDRVEFLGSIYQQDMLAPLFNSAWLTVSPGYVGLSVIHSLAYGVPIVVAEGEPHRPEIGAFDNGRNGVSFPAGDVDGLSHRLISLRKAPEQLMRLGHVGRRTIQGRLSIPAMVRSFERAVAHAQRTRPRF